MGISPPRGFVDDEGEPAHWTAEEVGAFLDLVDARLTAGQTVTETRKRRSGTSYTYRRTFAADPMQRALWYVLATTGMRRGEASGLRWGDVDLEAGMLTVRQARVVAGGLVYVSAPKTRRGRRTIALDGQTVAVLREWRGQQRREHLRFKRRWEDDTNHVFTHTVVFERPKRYGVAVRPDWITAAFRAIVAGSGLPPLHLHGLRHS